MDSPDESIALALARALMRKGLLDEDDITAAADEIDADDADAAHRLRCTILEVAAPTQAEWAAERARSRFRVIEGGEQ